MTTSRPWIEKYDPGVPARLDYPEICVQDFLTAQAIKTPKRIAIIADSINIDYQVLQVHVNTVSQQLIQMGLEPGDRVGLCLPNTPGFVIAFFSVLQAGGVVAAMNPMFPARELAFQVNTADVGMVITNKEKAVNFQIMNINKSLEVLILLDEFRIQSDISGNGKKGKVNTGNTLQGVRIPPSAPAVIQFSGGTTGTPKAAVGTHKNLVANVTQFRHWLLNLEDEKEVFLIAIPMYHVYGLVLGLILGVATGATLVLVEKTGSVEDMLTCIGRYPISYFPAVPSIFNMINNHHSGIHRDQNLNQIKVCISGSAPLLETIRSKFESITGGTLVEGYGLSEAPTATHCNPVNGEKKPGSIGLPLPDVDCRIVSIDDDRIDLPPEQEGELLIRGPQVMEGYFKSEQETAQALSGGWLHTGDIAWMDNDGFFYISGRKKDLIKVHGMQVWPVEVEEVISKYPGVLECAVAGVPDLRSGEKVVAWMVLAKPGTIDLKKIREYCKDKIAAYKIPTEIIIHSVLPRTPVGKVLRRELVREYLESK